MQTKMLSCERRRRDKNTENEQPKKHPFLAAVFYEFHVFLSTPHVFLSSPGPPYNVEQKRSISPLEMASRETRRSTLYGGPGDRLEIFSIQTHVVILSHAVGSMCDANRR